MYDTRNWSPFRDNKDWMNIMLKTSRASDGGTARGRGGEQKSQWTGLMSVEQCLVACPKPSRLSVLYRENNDPRNWLLLLWKLHSSL